MEDVTDTVFRRIVRSAGAPDLLVTEFTSTDGLCTAGRPRVIGRLRYTFGEKPLVAQVWGNNPEHYRRVAQEVREMGFDGAGHQHGLSRAQDHRPWIVRRAHPKTRVSPRS